MRKRGVSSHAAFLVVLLMMMSTLVMLPSQNVIAQSPAIQGIVTTGDSCSTPVDLALVTLTDAHGLDPTFTTGPSGSYRFEVGPGFYELEVTKDGYFSQRIGPFRFNALKDKPMDDICLLKTPDKDIQISGTVLSSELDHVADEMVTFPTEIIADENVTESFDRGSNTTNVSRPPIVYLSETGTWYNWTGGSIELIRGTHYNVTDHWSGVIEILDSGIAAALSNGTGSLVFSYTHSETSGSLDNDFIVTGYEFRKNSQLWLGTGNYTFDMDSGDIEVLGNFTFGKDELTVTYDYHPTVIQNASLTLYNTTTDHKVHTTTSGLDGTFTLSSWPGLFELQVWAESYQPNISTIQVVTDRKMRILMDQGIRINGWVYDDGDPPRLLENVELRAYLFCLDAVPESKKLLKAKILDNHYYEVYAFPGNFTLIVDATGYQAGYANVTVTEAARYDFHLSLSDEERVETSIGFVRGEWNEIVVYKNLTLTNDSHIPSLGVDPLGTLFLEVDMAVGNSDGTLNLSELQTFENWLTERGPQFLRTTDFFRVEQKEYTLELDAMQESKYSVSVSVSVDRVWINTVSWYNTTGIQPNEDFYTLHLDAYYDEAQNIGGEDRTLRNYTYRIELPPGYELYSNSSINTDVIGFTDILIDPMRGSGVGTVTLTANRSWEGTAHAEVTCPKEGENELYFHLVNDDPKNYSVVVPAEVEVCFSAEKSEDPNGPSGKISPYANFTWDFGDGTKGYGINPTHNYSDPGTAEANYTVRLDILEPGHNETNISINVKVDARAPVAKVWFDPEVYADQHIKEDVSFRFSANLSTDEMYDGQEGNITKWYWDHDSDGNWDEYTEEVETDFFTEPGKYWFNLTVEDWVGHKSENYSILLIVDDVTPPDASFFVLNDTYVKVDSVYENKTMYFNASDTVDNFSTQENLTFTWSIGGENKTGVNVSYIFEEAGEYDINLTVSDDEGNEGYYNITLPVLINPAIHANLKVVPDSLNFTPESPEEGTPVKISVEITNDEDSSEAVGVQVVFSIINEHTTKIGATVRFYDEEGNATTNTIPPGGRIKAEITWTPGTHGKYMIQVNCSAENEPPEHIHDDNKAKEELTVREAGWVTPLIIAVLIVLIFIIAIILLVRRKFAGRLPSIRKRKRLEEKRKKKVKK